MEELISVIVPAYNVETYLAKSLDSILSQSYRNIEVVVVDDGSKDGTAGIIDQYARMNPGKVVALYIPNGGVTHARLTGVQAAHGTWIGFMDADDYIEPCMYERLMANAQAFEADISQCGYQLVLPDEVVYYYNTGRMEQQDAQRGVTALLDGSYIEPGLCNKLFRKTLFHGLYQSKKMELDIRNNEDLLMNFFLFREAKRIVYEDFCPYHYLLRVDSATTQQLNEHKLKDPMKVLRILLEETKENEEQYMAVRRRYIRLLCNNATMLLGCSPELIKPYRKEMRRELRQELPGILAGTHYGTRLKMLALCAGILPSLYAWIHQAHIRLNGLDKTWNLKKQGDEPHGSHQRDRSGL